MDGPQIYKYICQRRWTARRCFSKIDHNVLPAEYNYYQATPLTFCKLLNAIFSYIYAADYNISTD